MNNNNLKIKDMPKNERPVEKLLLYGPETLSNSELLAIILRTGVKGENVLSLSSRIISELEGVDGILDASIGDIMKIRGIKNAKGSQILAIGELFRRFNASRALKSTPKINSPKDVFSLLNYDMGVLKQEVLKLICLNTKNEIIKIKDVFVGGLNSSLVYPREIFNEAIKNSSASIIICHNHPSGDPTPSGEDIKITERLKECGNILGVSLVDHIIICKTRYISLKEQGII